MATIDNQSIIDMLILNNDRYDDGPQIHSIVQYTNAYGNITHGVSYRYEFNPDRYLLPNPPYVNNPKLIWHYQQGIVKE